MKSKYGFVTVAGFITILAMAGILYQIRQSTISTPANQTQAIQSGQYNNDPIRAEFIVTDAYGSQSESEEVLFSGDARWVLRAGTEAVSLSRGSSISPGEYRSFDRGVTDNIFEVMRTATYLNNWIGSSLVQDPLASPAYINAVKRSFLVSPTHIAEGLTSNTITSTDTVTICGVSANGIRESVSYPGNQNRHTDLWYHNDTGLILRQEEFFDNELMNRKDCIELDLDAEIDESSFDFVAPPNAITVTTLITPIAGLSGLEEGLFLCPDSCGLSTVRIYAIHRFYDETDVDTAYFMSYPKGRIHFQELLDQGNSRRIWFIGNRIDDGVPVSSRSRTLPYWPWVNLSEQDVTDTSITTINGPNADITVGRRDGMVIASWVRDDFRYVVYCEVNIPDQELETLYGNWVSENGL